MATKEDALFFTNKQLSSGVTHLSDLSNQYSNLNLNQTYSKSHESPIQSLSKSNTDSQQFATSTSAETTVTLSNEISKTSSFKKTNYCPYLCLNDKIEEDKAKMKKKKNTAKASSSTLSLHIAAYENSVEAADSCNLKQKNQNPDLIKKWKNVKQTVFDSASDVQHSFEFPRQQHETAATVPEVMQFKASQQLLNPNKPSPPNHRNLMKNDEKKEMVRKWKEGLLETKPILKGSYVPIVENAKVIGHICNLCEKYFIGSSVGGAQRNHACTKKICNFTASQKQLAKDSSLKMVKTNLYPFAIVRNVGLLGFAKSMIEIGAELDPHAVKNLTIDDIKNLLPHPTTLSNHINKLSTKKEQLYAILKRKSNDSGIALMIDSTTKSYHYTGISISFIDENWCCQTLLIDLISGHGKGEGTAEYASEKSLKFLKDFGIDISILNAFITDEAAAMISAFGKTGKHIVCICHMISTVCKHTLTLYAKDKTSNPQLHQSLQIIYDLKKKLKEVITTVRGKIHINKIISHPLYQSNETRFLSFSTSLDSFLSLTEEDHALIDAELTGHSVYAKYVELVEAKEDLRTIYNVLYPTITALRTLEVDKKPSLHLVLPCLADIYNEWSNIENWDDEIEYSMKTAGLLALKQKIGMLHDYHYFAVILDPNSKMKVNDFLLPDASDNTRGINELVQKLRAAVKSYVVRTRRYRPRASAPIEADNPFAESLANAQTDSADSVVDNDINKYLQDNETYTSSILDYWKKAAAHLPYLASFAKHLLSIPASSCPLERSFSVLNKVDCKQRPQLDQDTITNIVLFNALEKYFPTLPDPL